MHRPSEVKGYVSVCYRNTVSTKQEGFIQSHTPLRFSWHGAEGNFGLILLILSHIKEGLKLQTKNCSCVGWAQAPSGGWNLWIESILRSFLWVLWGVLVLGEEPTHSTHSKTGKQWWELLVWAGAGQVILPPDTKVWICFEQICLGSGLSAWLNLQIFKDSLFFRVFRVFGFFYKSSF